MIELFEIKFCFLKRRSYANQASEDSPFSSPRQNSQRYRQPLQKQTSVNNPPTQQLSKAFFADHDEDFYESSKPKNKTFTSNQELMQNSGYLNQENSNYFSSPSSSISQINSATQNNRSRTRERLQDPLKILKTIRHSSSNLNSPMADLNGDNDSNKKNNDETNKDTNNTVGAFIFFFSSPSSYMSLEKRLIN